ncbi:tyrosine-type recombinase/integrase [Planctomycetota bacterium]
MASIVNDPRGRKRIQFTVGNGSRKTIRLGKATKRQAESVKFKIEQLVLAATGITNVVDDATADWLAGLDGIMYDKLAIVGLVAPRITVKLGKFIDAYIGERKDVKSGTTKFYGHTRRNLIDFFGADKPLREITPGDADQWRLYLLKQGLAKNTVRRRCGVAKQFFRATVRRRFIQSNPFEDLKSTVKGNPKREYFVTREEADKVLEACIDAQWRLIFALCRYGGLRCPSEVLGLRWQDINWDRSQLVIRSPKTEHHEGKESRIVPLFPELLSYLREVFEEAEPGSEYVITRYRSTNCNLRPQLQRIIREAGLKPWPKPFQNLRSTRETELAEVWPEHVVCAWIGNSRKVAREHYLQVTDEHFERAAQLPKETDEVVQNAAQQNPAEPCTVSHPITESMKYDAKRNPAGQCDIQLVGTGPELILIPHLRRHEGPTVLLHSERSRRVPAVPFMAGTTGYRRSTSCPNRRGQAGRICFPGRWQFYPRYPG